MRPLVKRMLSVCAASLSVGAVSQKVPPTAQVLRAVYSLTPNAENHPSSDFVRFRQRAGTHLLHVGSAPDLYKDPATHEGVRLTRYPSGGNELKAWQLAPSHNQLWTAEGYPAVVYVHDGTSLSEEEVAQARLFSEAGFAVFAPAFRGENGNPGVHELLYGELDDLVAATKYASELPHVDERRVAIWGHGLGGMLSALASLVPKLGVHYTGSSAGLRPTSAFEVLQKPFEDTAQERSLRLFGPNIQHMRSPHWACVAEEDLAVDSEAAGLREMALELHVPLHVERVAGNRASSRATCTQHAVVFLSKSFGARTWTMAQ